MLIRYYDIISKKKASHDALRTVTIPTLMYYLMLLFIDCCELSFMNKMALIVDQKLACFYLTKLNLFVVVLNFARKFNLTNVLDLCICTCICTIACLAALLKVLSF